MLAASILRRGQESGAGRVANAPDIKWAQRADSLYVTVALPDVTNHTIKVLLLLLYSRYRS